MSQPDAPEAPSDDGEPIEEIDELEPLDGSSASIAAWLTELGAMNHYRLFDLPRDASEEAIRAAFHRFAESFHPDRHRAESEFVRSGALRIFRRAAEAYRVLRDRQLRAAYDLELAKLTNADSGSSRSLDELCQTAAGRLHARRADRAITDGHLGEAIDHLRQALLDEGDNPALEERLHALADLRALS